MPIYEYICPLGHRSEEMSSRIKQWHKCPQCGKRAKHAFSPPAIRFHGSGFYSTDYKKDSSKGSSKKAGS